MALFARLKGGDESIEKIPVWPFLNYFVLVLEGKRTVAQMAVEFNLDAAEQTKLNTYATNITSQVSTEISRRVTEGISSTTANKDTRVFYFVKLWQALSQVEAGYMTDAELEQVFGVT